MGSLRNSFQFLCCCCFFFFFFLVCSDGAQTAQLIVDTKAPIRKMPDTLFGIFFEEINHAGAGGLWAELVSNRGFEAGGPVTPSNIDPWALIGNESCVFAATDRSSCFKRNKVALRLEMLCDSDNATNICPSGGCGITNPGYWGMKIEKDKWFTLTMYVRSEGPVNISIALTSSNGLQTLAATNYVANACTVGNWTKFTANLRATATDLNARLQLTTTQKGVIWFDQVSVMPVDTHKNHNFRKDLVQMLADLKPRFLRFPGGCFVEGDWLRNAFRWKETIGPWEERPGHFGDVWQYWTDDGLGYFEFLQLAEDLGTVPIWVLNNGISHHDEVDSTNVGPFVQEALDSIEFAKGPSNSTWGSVRASMGHPDPFNLKYIAIGNEDCWKKNYRGNYMRIYDAIKAAYPDMKIISNCDGSAKKLNHPADYYDYHVYTTSLTLFNMNHQFDRTTRDGPKAFVSEYAVRGKEVGTGNLLAALAEAAFLLGVERNSDVVEMASYAPLFVNANDRTWNPDAIVFDASHVYGTPSYWMQKFFSESSGATLLNSSLTSNPLVVATAITWKSSLDNNTYIRIKVVNFLNETVSLKISMDGLQMNSLQVTGLNRTQLTSTSVSDENSFKEPSKVVPAITSLKSVGKDLDDVLPPYSFTAFDFLVDSSSIRMVETGDGSKASV